METINWWTFVATIILSVAFTAFLYRLRRGRFRIVGTTATAVLFKTSIGEFRLDKRHNRLQVKNDQGGWSATEFSQIRGLTFKRNEADSWWSEWMTGINIWDLSGRYRDQVITCTIDISCVDGTAIPLYTASQLEEREFWLWGMWARFVRHMLELIKLSTNIDKHSESVYEDLQIEFRRHGIAV